MCIATFGAESWRTLAEQHALPSARAQRVPVVMHHGDTLAHARNMCAVKARSEWLIYLDADDQLGSGYVAAMARGRGDLRAPLLVEDGHEVRHLRRRKIEKSNPCVIGTAIRADLLADCGGWPEFPVFEDWALFLRASRLGATIEHISGARYLATSREGSRNKTLTRRQSIRLMDEVRAWA